MGTDPDKKVKKLQKERAAVYQSNQQPRHFDNEGEEYVQADPEIESPSEGIQKNKNVERSKGAG